MSISLEKMEHTALQIGHSIGSAVNQSFGEKQMGFALLLFDFYAGGNLTYISNAERQDMIRALEECVSVLRAGKDESPIPPRKSRH